MMGCVPVSIACTAEAPGSSAKAEAIDAQSPARMGRAIRTRALAFAAFALGALPVATGCAVLPERGPERALYVDVRKAVALRESSEWVVDRMEIEAIAPSVMRSACQVSARDREGLLRWVDAQIERAGGPAEAQFRAARERGQEPRGSYAEALHLGRVRAVLRYAEAHAEECPFWLEARTDFAGVQGDAQRFVLLAESAGAGGAIVSGRDVALAGGGRGRLLAGFGVASRLTLAVGAELGGIGTFRRDPGSGERVITGVFTAALPVMVRVLEFSRIIDLELAATARWSTDAVRLPPGVRAMVGYGFSTMRVGAFMPTAVLYLSYEYLPPATAEAAEHVIQLGTKVGLDWDP
jgi:hypothetical protein